MPIPATNAPSPTPAQVHEGQRLDYAQLLYVLRNKVNSLTDLSCTLITPDPASPLGQEDPDSPVPAVRMATFYGLAPWDPADTKARQTALDHLEERLASHCLRLEDDFNILDVKRHKTKQEQQILQSHPPLSDLDKEKLRARIISRDIIDTLQKSLPNENTSLFSHLAGDTLSTLSTEHLRATPSVYLQKILLSAEAEKITTALLSTLNWYGGKHGEQTCAHIRLKVLASALRLWLKSPVADSPQGFDVQSPAHWGKSYRSIRQAFENHLIETKRAASEKEAILIARLFLGQLPVEFQIHDIPPDLPYRASVVWVNFLTGVNLARAEDPDSLCRYRFQQLVNLALQRAEGATAEQLDYIALARLLPSLEWAATQGFIPEKQHDAYTQADIETAASALDKHSDVLTKAIAELDVPPPQRLDLARREIEELFPVGIFINDGRKLARFDNPAANARDVPALKDHAYTIHSFLEVYASGKFNDREKWFVTQPDGKTVTRVSYRINQRREIRIEGTASNHPFYQRIEGEVLPDLEGLFNEQFGGYLCSLRNAYQTLLQSQLASLPMIERQALESGEVKVYTLRKATQGQEAQNETPQMHLPLRTRMGFIIGASHEGKTSWLELLPRAGIIRSLPDFDTRLIGAARKTEHWKIFKGPPVAVDVLRSKTLPFDWNAHEKGGVPKAGATCEAIIEPLGRPLAATRTRRETPDTLTSSRTATLVEFIARELLFIDENALRAQAWGQTDIEREEARGEKALSIGKLFIPFWNSIEDLESGDRTRLIGGVFGLLTDLMAFAQPVGKFAAGSATLLGNASRLTLRARLPAFATLTKQLLISSVMTLNPLDGVPSLLRALGSKTLRLGKSGVFGIKVLAGRAGHYSFVHSLPQVHNTGHWRPLAKGDGLASVRGVDDVPVRNLSSTGMADYRLIDPLSSRPFGPSLTAIKDRLTLGRSTYQALENTEVDVTVRLAENATVREMLEVDGRTTLLIDDVAYQLDGDLLRRADRIDLTDRFKTVPCRVRRDGNGVCATSHVTRIPAAPPLPANRFDETKGWALWFGDMIYTPAAGRAPMKTASLKHHANLTGVMEFRKGIYGRVKIDVPEQGLDDTFQVGAVICPSTDDSIQYVFARLTAGDFYVAEVAKGQSVRDALVFKPASTLPADLKAQLLTVYTGSLNANNMARIHGIDAVERAIQTMDDIAIPIGGHVNPPDTLTSIKVDTSPAEAVLFDHSTRMIVRTSTDGAATWKLSRQAPDRVRQTTAEVFNTLFKKTVVTLDATQAGAKALRIDDTMRQLQKIISRKRQRALRDPRNIAFAEIETQQGVREVYVSVSGNQGDTGYLPLFEKRADRKEVTVAGTRYVNIDSGARFPEQALAVSPDGKLQAIPHTIDNIEHYTPALTSRPTSLDTESKLISVIRAKYPDPKQLASITIATTMAPCDSCAVVMKQFAHDGNPDALKVIWK